MNNSAQTLRRVYLFLAGYTLVFWWLACRKTWMMNYNSGDTAIFVQALWSTLHGRFFWDSGLNMSFFGDHGGFIFIPLVPVFALFPYVGTVLFLQSFFIALAAIPVFLVARRVLSDQLAAWMLMIAFLFFPTIVSQHVNQVHDTQFILPFILFAFYFFEAERFRWFVVFAVLSCLGKENMPLTLIMFGVYAALQRRQWKWIVTPIAIGATALGLLFKVIMPYFRGDRPYRSFAYFGPLGNSPLEVIGSVVTKPGTFFGVLLSAQNIFFFIQLIQPVGWVLPFLSLPVIFVLPDLMVNLLADNTALKVIRWHYNMTVGAFLLVATIFSIGKLSGWLSHRYGSARYAAGLGVLVACLSVSHWFFWFDINEYRRPPQHEALVEALELVPPDASILVPHPMLAYAASRWDALDVQYFLYVKPNPEKIFQYQYVILDLNERQQPIPQKLVEALASSSAHELIFNRQNVLVFRRRGNDVVK